MAPTCRNVPDNLALHGPLRLRPNQLISHSFDEIQSVESDRECFTNSVTYVFMSIDSEKLRQAQQAERLCRTIVKTGVLYIGLISPGIFMKEARFAINLWFPAPVNP